MKGDTVLDIIRDGRLLILEFITIILDPTQTAFVTYRERLYTRLQNIGDSPACWIDEASITSIAGLESALLTGLHRPYTTRWTSSKESSTPEYC